MVQFPGNVWLKENTGEDSKEQYEQIKQKYRAGHKGL